MSKDDAISIIYNSKKFYNFFFTIYKKFVKHLIINETEVILNRAKDYYRNNRDELKVKARDKYRELFEKEKNIKRAYGRNRYNNMFEEDKRRLKQYQREYRRSRQTT